MGYCPRCGENSSLGSGPNIVAERRQPLRLPFDSKIVRLPDTTSGATVRYGGMRFKVERDSDCLLLWAIE